jgi:hypothetical protein
VYYKIEIYTEKEGCIMFYRVIKSKDNQQWTYDFDYLDDAMSWIANESYMDKNCINPVEYEYVIVEI